MTLAFGEIIKNIINNLYLGVDSERPPHQPASAIPSTWPRAARPSSTAPWASAASLKLSTFAAGFMLVMIALIVVFNLINSRTGRAIMAIRDNRIAAESVGINITKYKLTAFVISAALAGAAGALFAMNYSTIVGQ